MNNKMNLPTEYAVLSEEEMTYTEGGAAAKLNALDVFTTAATVVGAAVLGASYVWGISVSRDWLNKKSNREGNVFTILGRAADDIAADMSKSASNFVRDAVSATMVVGLAPLSAILMIL